MSPVRHKNIALVGKAAIRELSGSGIARHAILATNVTNVRFLPVPSALPQRADVRGAVAGFCN